MTPAISASAVALTPLSRAEIHAEERRLSVRRVNRATNRRRVEDRHGCEERAGQPGDDVAQERRGGEHRPGRDLPDGDGLEELLGVDPAEPVHEITPEP